MLARAVLIILGLHIMLNLTRPLISLFAADLGADTMEIGMITAAYAFFPLAFAIHLGKITDRIGDRVPGVLGAAGMLVGLAFPYFYPFMWSLYVSQAIVGISQILLNIAIQNVLGKTATRENRDHYYSMFATATSLGGVIGPVAGGYLAEFYSHSAAFLISVLVGILPVILSFGIPSIRRAAESGTNRKNESGTLSLLKIPALRSALASSALVLYSRDIFVAYFPLIAVGWGMSESDIGWIITIQGFSMVLVRFFLTRLTDRFSRGFILLSSIVVAGCAFLLIPLVGGFYAIALLSALMGVGLGCSQPLSMTTAYNASPKTRTGEVLGLRLAVNRLSQLIAPLFFGLLGSSAGVVSVFYVSGAFLIGGALATRPKEEEITEEPQS